MKTQMTVYVDEEIVRLMDLEVSKDKSLGSRSKLVNNVMKKYYRQRINGKDDYFDIEGEELIRILGSIKDISYAIYRGVNYQGHLLNGGLPVFDTDNPSTRIMRPTNNLRSVASKKCAYDLAKLRKGDLIREDYIEMISEEEDK